LPNLDDYILDTLLRDLVGHDHRPAAYLVYVWLCGEQARRSSALRISFQELAENTGLSRSAAQSAVSWLKRRKLISSTKENATDIPTYNLHTPWRRHTS
jgi:CRP-like cAMP-binding protein